MVADDIRDAVKETRVLLGAAIRRLDDVINATASGKVEQDARDWFDLYDLKKGDFRRTKPDAVRHKGGLKAVHSWKGFELEVVGSLIRAGLIAGDTPRPSGKRRLPIVSRDKSRLSQLHGGKLGSPDSYIAPIAGFWMDTWGEVGTKASNLIGICQEAGVDPTTIKVRVPGGPISAPGPAVVGS